MVRIKFFVILLSSLVFATLLLIYLIAHKQKGCFYSNNRQDDFQIIEIIFGEKAKREHKLFILDKRKNAFSQLLALIPIKVLTDLPCSKLEKIVLPPGSAVIFHKKQDKIEVYIGRMSARYRLMLGLPIDINSAPPEVLKEIPYLNSKVVDLLASRREKKPFKTLSELLEIRGMGIRTFNKVSKKLECLPSPPKSLLICSVPYQS